MSSRSCTLMAYYCFFTHQNQIDSNLESSNRRNGRLSSKVVEHVAKIQVICIDAFQSILGKFYGKKINFIEIIENRLSSNLQHAQIFTDLIRFDVRMTKLSRII